MRLFTCCKLDKFPTRSACNIFFISDPLEHFASSGSVPATNQAARSAEIAFMTNVADYYENELPRQAPVERKSLKSTNQNKYEGPDTPQSLLTKETAFRQILVISTRYFKILLFAYPRSLYEV